MNATPSKGGGSGLIMILGLLVVVAIGILVWYFMTQTPAEGTPTSAPSGTGAGAGAVAPSGTGAGAPSGTGTGAGAGGGTGTGGRAPQGVDNPGGNPCTMNPPVQYATSYVTNVNGFCVVKDCQANYDVAPDAKSCVYRNPEVNPVAADCGRTIQPDTNVPCLNENEAGFGWTWPDGTIKKYCQSIISFYIIEVFSDVSSTKCQVCNDGFMLKLDERYTAGNDPKTVGKLMTAGINGIWSKFFKNQNIVFKVTAYDKNNQVIAENSQTLQWGQASPAPCKSKGVVTYPAFPAWNEKRNLMGVNLRNEGQGNSSGWQVSTKQIWPYGWSQPGGDLTANQNVIDGAPGGTTTLQSDMARAWKGLGTWGFSELNPTGKGALAVIPKGGTIVPVCDAPVAWNQNWDAKPSWYHMVMTGGPSKDYKYTLINECKGAGAQGGDYRAGWN